MKNIFLSLNIEPIDIIVYLGSFALTSLLVVLITRAIFSIPKFLKYQKAQTVLLLRIAKNNGLTDSEMSKIKELINPDESGNMEEVKLKELLKEL